MKKLIAAVALGIGFVMFVIGLATYLSPADYVSRNSIGVPGDQALWLAIGGLLASISGAFGLVDGDHSKQSESDTAHFHR